MLPVGFVVPIAGGIYLGRIGPDGDDCDWWIGSRDFGTGIRGETCVVDDDDIEVFGFGEHNCIKLLGSVRGTIGSNKEDDWIFKFVNKDWGRWFGSTVNGTGDRCLLS